MIEKRERLPTPSHELAIFLLYDPNTNKFLLEERRAKFKGDKMAGFVVVPSGKLEPEDYLQGGDYFINALFREVGEEFGVVPESITFLIETEFTTPNQHFYRSRVFLITRWAGEVVNKEGKHEHEWVPLSEAEDRASLTESKEFIAAAKARLNGLNVT